MKKTAELAGFIIGCAILAASIGIGWANLGRLPRGTLITTMQTLMGASIAALAYLVVIGILSTGRDRWRALALGSILLLVGLLVWLFDVGLFFAPIPVALLVYCLFRLQKEPA